MRGLLCLPSPLPSPRVLGAMPRALFSMRFIYIGIETEIDVRTQTALRHGMAWHHYEYAGRVRPWDGSIGLVMRPVSFRLSYDVLFFFSTRPWYHHRLRRRVLLPLRLSLAPSFIISFTRPSCPLPLTLKNMVHTLTHVVAARPHARSGDILRLGPPGGPGHI